MEKRCAFFLAKKNRFCANAPLKESSFCGNHNLRVEEEEERILCPIDSSHSILRKNLDAHLKKCPLHKHTLALEALPYYNKGINSGEDDEEPCNCGVGNGFCYSESASAVADDKREKKCCSIPLDRECSQISSEMKRNAIYKMHVLEFCALLDKIKSIYTSLDVRLEESVIIPEAGDRWMKRQSNREIPFQEKHALQQASILGNMELSEILQKNLHPGPENAVESSEKCEDEIVHPAVVEFGAGRGYLTHMLTDCYGIKKVYLVERRSYKLKADRSLRQEEDVSLERLRIDIEDLNLEAIQSLRGIPFLAIGKHLCGPATDMTLRCCMPRHYNHADNMLEREGKCRLKGLAIATCCHHLCQWKPYINKKYMSSLGITKDEFHAITWFSSWAVDADHGSDLSNMDGLISDLQPSDKVESDGIEVADIMKKMNPLDRAVIGFICKEIIDIGRLMWMKEQGLLNAKLIKYVSSTVSPENHLLIGKPGS